MGVAVAAVARAGPDVPGVVEDRAIRAVLPHQGGHPCLEAVDRQLGESAHRRLVRHIDAACFHLGAAGGAHAGPDADDIEKDPVQLVAQQRANLCGLGGQEVIVAGVDAQRLVETGLGKRRAFVRAAGLSDQPLGAGGGRMVVPLDRDVDWRPDTGRMQGTDLLQQQVAVDQVRVDPLRELLRRVVQPAVVAAGEDRHRVDSRVPDRLGEGPGIEIGRNAGYCFGRVKIKVDLPACQLHVDHPFGRRDGYELLLA